MINDYIFVGVFFFLFFFFFLAESDPDTPSGTTETRYSCLDHCTDVPLNFKLNKEGLNYIFETSNDAWCRQ